MALDGIGMVRSIAGQPVLKVRLLIEKILAAGVMSRQEYLELTSALLSSQAASEGDRRQINRVFDYIQSGRLKLVD